jgi:hypothetical protein
MSKTARPTAKTNRPNILFILIDDMGRKDIGCSGSTYDDTPHIDKLASEGIRFLNPARMTAKRWALQTSIPYQAGK